MNEEQREPTVPQAPPSAEEIENIDEKAPKKKSSPLYDAYSLLHDLVYILAAITLIFVFFVRLVSVNGDSMLPTLRDGDFLALQSNVIMGDLKYGDIIVARKESFRDGEPIVKRVIATEGQHVQIQQESDGFCTVYVDGVKLEETYIREAMRPRNFVECTVADNCVFVMGDNRNDSMDSRSTEIGQLQMEEILGKVLFIAFPGTNDDKTRSFSRIGAVS